MFCAMKRALVALQAVVMPAVVAARRAREKAALQERAKVVLALARPVPGPGRLVVLPPQLPLAQALQEAQALRAGVVPRELLPAVREALAARPTRTPGSRKSTGSSAARTARRSTSKRRRAR